MNWKNWNISYDTERRAKCCSQMISNEKFQTLLLNLGCQIVENNNSIETPSSGKKERLRQKIDQNL